jgi:hypothetical protein
LSRNQNQFGEWRKNKKWCDFYVIFFVYICFPQLAQKFVLGETGVPQFLQKLGLVGVCCCVAGC